ncbi:MAG: AAA family ATPase [Paludibacter sp. 47-17]|nr:MAG: AAA family ATPase [Paludibacter sp.]OJX83403.1 MAG: AAA family ATPase [Paludibacter sp. 47-17]
MIIKKIKLHNWKNFQNCEVDLSERCFIIGANAAGKSNFIDALRFLRDISKQAGGLQSAVEGRGGITKIRCLAARTQTNVSITVELGDPNEAHLLWKYHLDIQHTGGGIMKSQVKILKEQVFSFKENQYVCDRDDRQTDEDEETLKYTHLEQANANRKFRELQVFFQNIEYLNLIPQLVRESSSLLQSYSKEDYYGRNFLEKLAKINERTRNSYFKKINEFLKIAVPQLEELRFIKDEMGVPHIEARYMHWRARGSKQQEAQFSDGTLRLIGFLFALIDNNGVILLEEPEINLHSGIITQLPEFIAKIQRSKKGARQIIITTHSYDMLANQGISSNEVILLQNTSEGTTVNRVSDIDDIRPIIEAGLSIADAVIPFTKPKNIEKMSQLSLDF